jgi:ABC-2 type transport system ATP-binding protein
MEYTVTVRCRSLVRGKTPGPTEGSMTQLAREENAAAPAAGAATAGAAVAVQGLEYAYGERQALRGVSFEVGRGEVFGLLGPNGGGKTTLFRILSTILTPQRGTAHILGYDLARQRSDVRRHLGVVFQSPALDRRLQVHENLTHQGHLYGLRGAELQRRIDAGLQRFGLAERSHEVVENLSGGLRRRVELAKGLLHSPEVLILDEPSTGLDPGARRDLWQILQDVRSTDGVTVLLTSHILEEVEKCDRVAILDRGALVALGTPSELESNIGGDVLKLETREPARLAPEIMSRFGVQVLELDGKLRIEHERGHELLRQIVEAFPGDIASVTLSKPTLEDVFVRATGHTFWEGENGVDPAPQSPRGRGAKRQGGQS